MQICSVSAPSQQFIKILTGGLHLKINVSYTKTTVPLIIHSPLNFLIFCFMASLIHRELKHLETKVESGFALEGLAF